MKPNYRDMSLSEIYDLLIDRPLEFDFFNIETKCFYRIEGVVIKRFSKTLRKWILELNKDTLDVNASIPTSTCFLIILLNGDEKLKTFNDFDLFLNSSGYNENND